VCVMLFHIMTALFFNIGMFPYIMITITFIFLKPTVHLAILNRLKSIFNYQRSTEPIVYNVFSKPFMVVFVIHFAVQCLIPFRYMLYKQPLFWAEQGYRFSWRVMLMEKAGATFFTVKDKQKGYEEEITNRDYLNYMQEKMMSTQPDIILQYAQYLKQQYLKKGWNNPSVYVKSYVTLNGRGSRLYVNDTIDLSLIPINLKERNWLIPSTP
jgi:hypothetical protein